MSDLRVAPGSGGGAFALSCATGRSTGEGMERHHELDWLRVILFALLVPHHAAVGFVGFGEPIYGFVNDRLAPQGGLTELGIYWSHSWRLPSLFLIAGIGTWFATRRAAGAGWLGRRMAWLLVPALFGACVLNVLAGYLIFRLTGVPRAMPAFWPDRVEAAHAPRIMHLWFLVNLAVYTLLLWPFLGLRDRLAGARLPPAALLAAVAAAATGVAVLAKPYAAGLAGNGYQFPWYLAFFLGGFVIGSRAAEVLDWTAHRVWWMLAGAAALFTAEISLLAREMIRDPVFGNLLAGGGWAVDGPALAFGPLTTGFTLVEKLGAWAWSLAALGLTARYLRRRGRWLPALNRAVYPLYVLHFPVVLVGLALLTRVAWPWPVEFLLLTFATYAVTAALYLLALRTGPAVRLIGGRQGP
jgi:hypothetical protein